MAPPIKKNTNEENNYDVVDFDYGDPSEWFNWICVACNEKARDPISLELQYLSDNNLYQDSDGLIWFRCEKCTTSIHKKCLGFSVNVELFKKFGQVVKCC